MVEPQSGVGVDTIPDLFDYLHDEEHLRSVEEGSRSKGPIDPETGKGIWVGCIGAVDGWLPHFMKPQSRWGIVNPDAYWTRKGYYSVNCQVCILLVMYACTLHYLMPR